MVASKASYLKAQIAKELYVAMEGLGAAPNLLSIIGSYGDTLSDEEILALLREHNARSDWWRVPGRQPILAECPNTIRPASNASPCTCGRKLPRRRHVTKPCASSSDGMLRSRPGERLEWGEGYLGHENAVKISG